MQRNIAVITARGGSKRIPRKNIRDFMGRPMISYAISSAKNSKIFEKILVSTDDKEIAEIAKSLGAWVPFLRSERNSDDHATTSDVLQEVVGCLADRQYVFDNICCIYPCVPLLSSNVLSESYKNFIDSGADALTPVVKFSYPIQRALRIDSKGELSFENPKFASARSQDLESFYHDVGMFYWMRFDVFNKSSPKTVGYIMAESQVQDIDTEEDWKLAELKYKNLQKNEK